MTRVQLGQAPFGVDRTERNSVACRYQQLVAEILCTERRYVEELRRFSTLKHLVQEQNILEYDSVDEIFGNVDALVAFHTRFLRAIEALALLPDPSQNWGAAFYTLRNATELYVSYISSHKIHMDAAIREHQKMLAADGPPDVLEQVAGHPMIYLTFQRPYSRFVKYSCFMKELLQEIGHNEARAADLQTAIELHNEALNKANTALTEKKLEQETAELLNRVEDWKGHNINTFGRLLFSDTVQCRPGTPRASEAQFKSYFFENVLIFCKQTTRSISNRPGVYTLRLKGRLYLQQILSFNVPTSNESLHKLEITWSGTPGKLEKTTISFTSSATLELWVDKLRQLRQLIRPQRLERWYNYHINSD